MSALPQNPQTITSEHYFTAYQGASNTPFRAEPCDSEVLKNVLFCVAVLDSGQIQVGLHHIKPNETYIQARDAARSNALHQPITPEQK